MYYKTGANTIGEGVSSNTVAEGLLQSALSILNDGKMNVYALTLWLHHW